MANVEVLKKWKSVACFLDNFKIVIIIHIL